MDLNLPLNSFIPNISSTRNLIDFALSTPHPESLRYTFISSIAAVQNWNEEHNGTKVPEQIITHSRHAAMFGYGESKHIAERILAMSGLQSYIFRVGQLCGAISNGAWTTKEWIPKIIKTSIALNAIPNIGGVVSWVPVDKMAAILLEITMHSGNTLLLNGVLNVAHPKPVTWTSIVHKMQKILQSDFLSMTGENAIEVIPFIDWIDALEVAVKSSDAGSGIIRATERYPAFALLERLRHFAKSSPPVEIKSTNELETECGGLPALSLNGALMASSSMRELLADDQVLGDHHVQSWIQYWQKVDFLPDQ
ncbi:hypothetical protein D9757_011141 [Collybiopsis confluens]|uniref:Thioester reductase (TE) domain-containing protein n=1 Tax=Collybiopsis confluens TaxID=2823264 RepID=A0A8H5H7M8_9AGAR|nr:hypothetical protein D9757_011141 [Collybiopsis confluens]